MSGGSAVEIVHKVCANWPTKCEIPHQFAQALITEYILVIDLVQTPLHACCLCPQNVHHKHVLKH